MRVCVVGSGGREHALARVLGRTAEVVVTPGSPGIPGSVATDPSGIDADLFVIGPEEPLVAGLADRLRAAGRRVLGPGADGARLEGSKEWMKSVLVDAGVPTAVHRTFTEGELDAAVEHLASISPPYVVKTDGLAAGKGVLVTDSLGDAVADVRAKLSGRAFGEAGRRVVIEEHLAGPELTVLALCDGTRAVPLAPSRDHKRVAEGEQGANTGGMGAFSPVPDAGPEVVAEVMATCVEPVLAELRRRGVDYRGVLYCGLVLTADGPRVLEFNVRFGDPEAQAVLPRLEGDVAALLAGAADGELTASPRFVDDAAVCVVLACEGYPTATRTGDAIEGLEAAGALPGVDVLCAGVDLVDGRLSTASGRAVDVVARGSDLATARERAYEAAERITWPGRFYRRDIAAAAAAAGGPGGPGTDHGRRPTA